MPVVRMVGRLFLPSVLLLAGCPNEGQVCPEATVIPATAEIPEGQNSTVITIDVENPDPNNGLTVITEITAVSGGIADPFARETTYTCAFDVSGEVEVCVNAQYFDPDGGVPDGGVGDGGVGDGGLGDGGVRDGGVSDGGVSDGGVSDGGVSDGAANAAVTSIDIGSSEQYIRPPHVFLTDPLECSETTCTTIICPEVKNLCPVVSSLTVDPSEAEEGVPVTVTVDAEDEDDNPSTLVTTLSANFGTIADPNARETTYTCDPEVGGIIEICVVATDGDATCDVQRCTTVLCPGIPSENTCPSIASFVADPITIPPGDNSTDITIDVSDPDDFPDPLRTELRSETGVFENRFVTETTFFCGESGPVKMCVEATDGDPSCDQTRCITVQCPSDIPPNVCPMLFVLNAIPSTIAPGNISTRVESRAQDTDGLPVPLELTMRALWGTISDDENMNLGNNVVAQDAMYTCDRPGEVEVCVDATDGACVKTLCIEVDCPNDITPP